MNLLNITETAAFLSGCGSCLVYTHATPDGDTVGSGTALVLALRAAGINAFAVNADGIPAKLDFLPTNGVFIEEPEDISAYTLISVDISSERMLGSTRTRRFDLSIDHHKVNTVDCDRLLLMADKIAAGEIIYHLIKALGVEMTKDIAACLYTAICSDSGGFKYDLVTAETYRIAAETVETGIDFPEINRRLVECKTRTQIALERLAYVNLPFLCGGKYAVCAFPPEKAQELSPADTDYDTLNNIPREIEGVLASAVVRKKNGVFKVSLRSNAAIDVSAIAAANGGGGHFHAAGFSLTGSFGNAVEAVKRIFTELEA